MSLFVIANSLEATDFWWISSTTDEDNDELETEDEVGEYTVYWAAGGFILTMIFVFVFSFICWGPKTKMTSQKLKGDAQEMTPQKMVYRDAGPPPEDEGSVVGLSPPQSPTGLGKGHCTVIISLSKFITFFMYTLHCLSIYCPYNWMCSRLLLVAHTVPSASAGSDGKQTNGLSVPQNGHSMDPSYTGDSSINISDDDLDAVFEDSM